MTARTEAPTSTTRQNLCASCLAAARALIASLPGVSPLDVAVAHLGSGFALIVDPAVVDPATARRILTDLVAAFDAGASDPAATTH